MPTVFSFFLIFRQIVLWEKIKIVHGHASLSSMCREAVLHGRWTTHLLIRITVSLDCRCGKGSHKQAVGVYIERYGSCHLRFAHLVLDLSPFPRYNPLPLDNHTSKENTILRASLDHLGNSQCRRRRNFQARPSKASKDCITIVVISRLFYNKGIDLLVAARSTPPSAS